MDWRRFYFLTTVVLVSCDGVNLLIYLGPSGTSGGAATWWAVVLAVATRVTNFSANLLQLQMAYRIFLALCPPKAEATTFAIYSGIISLADVCERNLGELLTFIWSGETNAALEAGHFKSLWHYSAISECSSATHT